MDFTKAFDYVVNDVIWHKLIRLSVRGKILNVIMSMYKRVKSKVMVNNDISIGFECSLGVRKGECVSPFLFAMYVNDLEHEFQLKGGEGIDIGMLKIFLSLYADDITIFASSAEELQTNLNMLSEIKSEMRSFKSNENIYKKEGGSYYVVSANKASSVTL